jgi:hypothetical protein
MLKSHTVVLWFLCLPAVQPSGADERDLGLEIRHELLSQLGTEHIAHAIHREGVGALKIVAWGDRIVQWPLTQNGVLREVVSAQPNAGYSNGGCAMDLDGDGVEELIIARGGGRWARDPQLIWFREFAGHDRWTEHVVARIGTNADDGPHDIAPIVLKRSNGDSTRGVVLLISRKKLVWYEIPSEPSDEWVRHDIGTFPAAASQSGLAVGDIAGRGRPDIVCGMFWAECPDDPASPWPLHRFGNWDENSWGGMAKVAVADLDGDGKNEIVASEAEIPNARLGVFRRGDNDAARPWTCSVIDRGLYCAHSLVVTDVDGDGRADIIAGEMTAGGWDFPLNPHPRILAYRNQGQLRFDRHTIVEGLGVHELGMVAARNNRPLILYAADEIQPQKFADMRTHVSYWVISRVRRGR